MDDLVPSSPLEQRIILLGQSHGRFGSLAPDLIADVVLDATVGADWPVRKAAFDALVRRYGFAKRDGLTMVTSRGVLGDQQTAAQSTKRADRSGDRPYRTRVRSLVPPRISCGCPDFVRSGLGLCKHGMVILEAVAKRGALPTGVAAAQALAWEPRAPLGSTIDRLARLSFDESAGMARPRGFAGAALDPSVLADPADRLKLLNRLVKLIDAQAISAEPAVRPLLLEELATAERRVEGERTVKACLATTKTLTRALYPYQLEGLTAFLRSGRLLLGDDMGLGKTTQAVAACHALFTSKRVSRGLLVVPAALKPQWFREWTSTTAVPLTIVEGSPAERARLYREAPRGFLIMGYEQLLRDLPLVHEYAPEMLVLDEAQRVKNWATKSAVYTKSIDARYKLILTGTPMENRFDELASLMDLVDDVALEPKWRLAARHTIDEGNADRGRGGARNLNELRSRLQPVFLRRIRREVLDQLPARTDTRVPVELTEAQRAAHDELHLPIAGLVHAKRPLTHAQFLRLMSLLTTQRIICNGLAQQRFEETWPRLAGRAPTEAVIGELSAPKLLALRGLLEQIVVGQGRKAVVFSQWRSMLRLSEWAVRDLLAAAGLRAAFFTGAESPKQREHAIAEFHDDPTLAVLFLSDAGGVGLNLQRAASVCVNLELPWNPAVLEQRIGRIYRLGQTKPIDVFNLVAEEGIESRIATLVAQKKAVFSSLFDGSSDEVRFEGGASFLDSVKKIVEPVDLPDVGEPIEEDPAPEPATAPQPVPGVHGLRVRTTPEGGLQIDVPKELAPLLGSVFAELARSLGTS